MVTRSTRWGLAIPLSIAITNAYPQAYVCELPNRSRIVQSSPCPPGSKILSSTGSSQYQGGENSLSTGEDRELARLKEQQSAACNRQTRAEVDYRFAERNYTDQNAIRGAASVARDAQQECEVATQSLLNRANPAKAAEYRQARSDRDQKERADDMVRLEAQRVEQARQANYQAEQQRIEQANQQQRLMQEVQQLRIEQANAADEARKAAKAANAAAQAAPARGPTNCYQKMSGTIICN